jgi:hypothetical protein
MAEHETPVDVESATTLLRRRTVSRGRITSGTPCPTTVSISEHVWDANVDPFTNIVSVTMTRLRRKLGDPPSSFSALTRARSAAAASPGSRTPRGSSSSQKPSSSPSSAAPPEWEQAPLSTTIYANAKHELVVIPALAWGSGIGAAILIGAVAGLWPALRAARTSPTQALWSM